MALPLRLICITLSAFALGVARPSAAQPREDLKLPDEVVITADRKSVRLNLNFEVERVVATGHVVVKTSDGTTITGGSVSYDISTNEVIVEGAVTLTDALGRMEGRDLIYNLATQTGKAQTVHAWTGTSRLRASIVEIRAGLWLVRDVHATTCENPHPHYELSAKKLTIRPKREMIATNIFVAMLGQRVLWLPYFRLSLREGSSNDLPLPVPSYDETRGPSMSWRLPYPIGANVYTQGEATVSLNTVPETRLSILGGFSRAADPLNAAVNEEDARFNNGFLDQVGIFSLNDEIRRLQPSPPMFFAEHSANLRVFGRRRSDLRINKDWEVGAQARFPLGPFLSTATLRAGQVVENPGATRVLRAAADFSAALDERSLFGDFTWRPKVDIASFAYEGRSQFSWVRPQFEMYWRPMSNLAIGVAYVRSLRRGEPTLLFDDVDASEAVHFRVDARVAGTRLTTILKYDTITDDLFDVQVRFGQILHCIEPILTWRQNPQTLYFTFGIVNLESIEEAFRRRHKTISDTP